MVGNRLLKLRLRVDGWTLEELRYFLQEDPVCREALCWGHWREAWKETDLFVLSAVEDIVGCLSATDSLRWTALQEVQVASTYPESVTQLYVPLRCTGRQAGRYFLGLHTSGHHCMNSTLAQVQKRFYWPCQQDDMKRWCRWCDVCTRCNHTKPLKLSQAALHQWGTNGELGDGLSKGPLPPFVDENAVETYHILFSN